VGQPIDEFTTVMHRVPMLSIDNTYSANELKEFDRSVRKLLGGEAVARLFELQQAAPGGLDFASTVRIEGMKALRARHAASPDRAVDFPEVPANEIIDELLAIVDQVAVAMAN